MVPANVLKFFHHERSKSSEDIYVANSWHHVVNYCFLQWMVPCIIGVSLLARLRVCMCNYIESVSLIDARA
jgi:hypothetical protein